MKQVAQHTKKGESLRVFYEHIRNRDLSTAQRLIDSILGEDTSTEVITAYKCLSFWQDRIDSVQKEQDLLSQGEFYIAQWHHFKKFTEHLGSYTPHCQFAFQHYAFSQAIAFFMDFQKTLKNKDPKLSIRIAYCYRCMGQYAQAIQYYKQCITYNKEDAKLYAELADTYALFGEINLAKLLFREALFIDPQKINFQHLESSVFLTLFEDVKALNMQDNEAKEWLIIYGILWGILNIKRELRPIEQGNIKQKIYQLEWEVKENKDAQPELIPRLLTQYFRILEQYTTFSINEKLAQEYLLKIRSIAPEIYTLYIQ